MAFQKNGLSHTFKADSDMSTKQFYFVKLTGTDAVEVCDTGTDVAIGILQNEPSVGQAAEVMLVGISKLSSNSALTVGDLVAPSSDGQGSPVTIGTSTTIYVAGHVLTGSTAAAGLASVLVVGVPFRGA